MLTSGDQPGDLAKCRSLGISAFLTKPVRRTELRRALEGALGTPQVSSPEPSQKISPPPSRNAAEAAGLVLLIEDNWVNQRVTKTILERAGYSVVVADDGTSAIALLNEQPFDLILMDVQLPGMDGYETTAVIRELQKSTRVHTPIIAMTAHAMSGDRERCLAAGMDEYISKPVHRESLLESVTVCLKRGERPSP